MGNGFYRDLTDLLKKHGCYFHRQGKGDHEIWYSPISNRKIAVDKKTVSRFLANGILKQAGIDDRL